MSTLRGYCPRWQQEVADQVNKGASCPKCGGKLYGQPGSRGTLYKCEGCHTVWGAGSLYRQFGEQQRTEFMQTIERQRTDYLASTTAEERRAQAARDIEELF